MPDDQKPSSDPAVGVEDFTNVTKQLAEVVFRTVELAMPKGEWKTALFDVRFEKAGSSWLSKIRAATETDHDFSINMNNEIDLLLIQLNTMRCLGTADWFGLKLEIDQKRRCKITLNYDPDCSEDASFFT